MNKFLLVFCIVLCFFILNTEKARAQSFSGIKISPVKHEEIVEPGQKIRKEIKVTNDSNSVKTFFAYLRDFKAEGESGLAKLITPGTEDGYFLASWIDITGKGTEFQPGE